MNTKYLQKNTCFKRIKRHRATGMGTIYKLMSIAGIKILKRLKSYIFHCTQICQATKASLKNLPQSCDQKRIFNQVNYCSFRSL